MRFSNKAKGFAAAGMTWVIGISVVVSLTLFITLGIEDLYDRMIVVWVLSALGGIPVGLITERVYSAVNPTRYRL